MEQLEHLLASLAGLLKLILEGISVLCILVGLIKTVQLAARQVQRRSFSDRHLYQDPSLSLANLRLNFGRWLSLALEFQLGADIVNTTVAPSFDALGRLAVLALIRTFLNFFLTKELNEKVLVSNHNPASPSVNDHQGEGK